MNVQQKNAGTDIGIDVSVLTAIYRQMSRIHEVDKAIRTGLSRGKFYFSYWPMTGQEAIPATLASISCVASQPSRRDGQAWRPVPISASLNPISSFALRGRSSVCCARDCAGEV